MCADHDATAQPDFVLRDAFDFPNQQWRRFKEAA
jgi:hypothetical protein